MWDSLHLYDTRDPALNLPMFWTTFQSYLNLKKSTSGHCLGEVVAYESLDHYCQNFASLAYGSFLFQFLKVLFMQKVNFKKKIKFFPLRNFHLL